jgi:peptidyl-prolyl cis-trans isomerase D
MLGFFRRIINSKGGIIVTFLVLGIIAIAFAAGDVTGLQTGGGGVTGDAVVKVGDGQITPAELRSRVQSELEGIRQQQPTIDMASFVANGGFDATLRRSIGAMALQEFGEDVGMVVSKRLVDGQIASIPGLQGLTGQFDPAIYRRLLIERKLTDAQVRADIAQNTFVQQLVGPTQGAAQVPEQLALPYASLLLERRTGQVVTIPASAAAAGPAPTDAELQTFYRRNLQRYSVPERRVARYAIVTPDQVRGQAAPSEAEIAQAYQADRQRYAASEKRTVEQVVVADQAGANALAARVRAGATLAAAARAAGLEASTQTEVEKAAYAALTSPAVADAVFASQQGALVGPVRGALGFIVARVTGVERVPARTLDQVRGEITAALTRRKTTEALSALSDQVNDALAGNATFDEVIGDRKLTARSTPALAAAGIDPLNPASRPDPALAPVVQAAFGATEGDAPQLVGLGPDGSFAVVALARILPAAPRPLADVRQQVGRDFLADRGRQAARRIAAGIVAKVNRGTPLAQAVAQARVALPAPRPLAGQRAELVRGQPRAGQEALPLLFDLKQGAARLAPVPDGSGYVVLRLDRIDRGDAGRNRAVIDGARADLGRLVGREYAEQFARAARNAVGVKVDDAAVARVRAELTGQGNN